MGMSGLVGRVDSLLLFAVQIRLRLKVRLQMKRQGFACRVAFAYHLRIATCKTLDRTCTSHKSSPSIAWIYCKKGNIFYVIQ